MVHADVDRRGAEVVQLLEQLTAVRHRGVVGLVVADPAIDRFVRADGLAEVDLDGGRRRSGGRQGWRNCPLREQCGTGQHRESDGACCGHSTQPA